MKLPKSRTGLYVVSRHENGVQEGVPVGIFVTAESADNYAGSCEQKLVDSGITLYVFRTSYVMFYNE